MFLLVHRHGIISLNNIAHLPQKLPVTKGIYCRDTASLSSYKKLPYTELHSLMCVRRDYSLHYRVKITHYLSHFRKYTNK